MTLASLKEAEALVALEMGCDPMVATAGAGWRAADWPPGNELCTLGHSGLIRWGGVSRTVVESRRVTGVHGSRGRSGGSGQFHGLCTTHPLCVLEATSVATHLDPLRTQLSLWLFSSPHNRSHRLFSSIHSTQRFFTLAHRHALPCVGMYTLTPPQTPPACSHSSTNRAFRHPLQHLSSYPCIYPVLTNTFSVAPQF